MVCSRPTGLFSMTARLLNDAKSMCLRLHSSPEQYPRQIFPRIRRDARRSRRRTLTDSLKGTTTWTRLLATIQTSHTPRNSLLTRGFLGSLLRNLFRNGCLHRMRNGRGHSLRRFWLRCRNIFVFLRGDAPVLFLDVFQLISGLILHLGKHHAMMSLQRFATPRTRRAKAGFLFTAIVRQSSFSTVCTGSQRANFLRRQ